jgi:hypothetical protein
MPQRNKVVNDRPVFNVTHWRRLLENARNQRSAIRHRTYYMISNLCRKISRSTVSKVAEKSSSCTAAGAFHILHIELLKKLQHTDSTDKYLYRKLTAVCNSLIIQSVRYYNRACTKLITWHGQGCIKTLSSLKL